MDEITYIAFPSAQRLAMFVKLGEGRYFGGLCGSLTYVLINRQLDDYGIAGPHVWFTTDGLLNVIARIANRGGDPGDGFFTVEGGNELRECVPITREMDAGQLARALYCTEDDVRKCFDRLVTLSGGRRG